MNQEVNENKGKNTIDEIKRKLERFSPEEEGHPAVCGGNAGEV